MKKWMKYNTKEIAVHIDHVAYSNQRVRDDLVCLNRYSALIQTWHSYCGYIYTLIILIMVISRSHRHWVPFQFSASKIFQFSTWMFSLSSEFLSIFPFWCRRHFDVGVTWRIHKFKQCHTLLLSNKKKEKKQKNKQLGIHWARHPKMMGNQQLIQLLRNRFGYFFFFLFFLWPDIGVVSHRGNCSHAPQPKLPYDD